jgi:hypothetical protein
MAGLVIHVLKCGTDAKSWMPATSAGMTIYSRGGIPPEGSSGNPSPK